MARRRWAAALGEWVVVEREGCGWERSEVEQGASVVEEVRSLWLPPVAGACCSAAA